MSVLGSQAGRLTGRNAVSWERNFAYDIWYVEHLSLRLDVTILTQTLWKALQREGIFQAWNVAMESSREERQDEADSGRVCQ